MREETVWRLNGLGAIFRLITPLLITISLFILNRIYAEVQQIGDRLYFHQTNAELHVPRGEFERIRSDILEMRQEILRMLREASP